MVFGQGILSRRRLDSWQTHGECRAVFDFADNPSLDESVLYRSAAAAQLLVWRNEVIQRLQNAGVLSVDAFPDMLTTPLINRYLEVKAKHLL